MVILNEIKKEIEANNYKKITIFVDMDGVIADYRLNEGKDIKNNVPGTFINKRPINSTINNLKQINDEENIKLCILSSCLFQEQADEKSKWLDIHADFFKGENRFYTIADNSDKRKQLKVDKIREHIDNNECDLAILIDDTHEILFLAKKQLGSNFMPFHVITLLD